KAKYEFFENGAVAERPAGVVFNAEEAALLAKREAIRERMGLLNPWVTPQRSALLGQQTAVRDQLAKVADRMLEGTNGATLREVVTKIETGAPLSTAEQSVWNKFSFLKKGAKGEMPTDVALTTGEAQLVSRAVELEKSIAKATGTDAVAAKQWYFRGAKAAEG